MAEESTTSPISSDATAFTLFPKLPTELQLKIWKHAVPSPRVMQIHCIYPASTRSPNLSRTERCDAEAMTPGNEVEFGTDTVPTGLLRACKQSRKVMLKIHNGCIESGGRKIRFDKEKDIIFFHTTSYCCERGLPGMRSKPETLPDHSKIFADVQHLAICAYTLDKTRNDKLHGRTGNVHNHDARPSLVSEFRSLRTFYMVANHWLHMRENTLPGEILLQTLEEVYGPIVSKISIFAKMQQVVENGLEDIASSLEDYKKKKKLDDWGIPTVKIVGVNKIISLDGNKWCRNLEWACSSP